MHSRQSGDNKLINVKVSQMCANRVKEKRNNVY